MLVSIYIYLNQDDTMMTKQKLKHKMSEAIYQGNIGIHELMTFYQIADEGMKNKVESMFNSDNMEQAWHTIKDFLQSKGKLIKLTLEKKNKV